MTSPLNLYPISEKAPEQAVSASGLPLDRLTLDAVVSGRIGAADLRTMRYHLSNHALWLLPLALAPLYPWLLLVTLAMLVYLYLNLVRPVLAGVRERTAAPGAGWYVPPIVMARSLCNNVGQLVGWWEYRHGKGFRSNLDSYLAGRWSMESGA